MWIRSRWLLPICLTACADAKSASWLDTGDLDAKRAVLVTEGTGWMTGSAHTRAATRDERPRVAGWPVAACVDSVVDGRCDFEREPFALCSSDGDRLRCTVRPWKLTLTRTQVFDGTFDEGDIELSPRADESGVHASVAVFQPDGRPVPSASLCWAARALCSTKTAADPGVPPLELCGVESEGAADLELNVGGHSRRFREPLPDPLDIRIDHSSSREGLTLRVHTDRPIAQLLVQLRSSSDEVLWSSERVERLGPPANAAEVTLPYGALDAAPGGAQLLVQLVALRQSAPDARLLTQSLTEARVWAPLDGRPAA